MEKCIIFNVKPSNRICKRFVQEYPEANYLGAASLKSKSKSYLLPLEIYELDKEKLKAYGAKARCQ